MQHLLCGIQNDDAQVETALAQVETALGIIRDQFLFMPNLVPNFLPAIYQYRSDPKQAQHRSCDADPRTPGRGGVEREDEDNIAAKEVMTMQVNICK